MKIFDGVFAIIGRFLINHLQVVEPIRIYNLLKKFGQISNRFFAHPSNSLDNKQLFFIFEKLKIS